MSDSLPVNPASPYELTASGTVTDVRAGGAGDDCLLADSTFRLGVLTVPEVVIDLASADGTTLTIGVSLPGFGTGSVAVGQSLTIQYDYYHFMFDLPRAKLEISSDGLLLAGVGDQWAVGVDVAEGVPECYSTDGTGCGIEGLVMVVTAPGGAAAEVSVGESVQVGDFLVSNDEMVRYQDIGGCEAPPGTVDLVMGVARTQ